MKTFVVFLVSTAVLCSAASVNNENSEKNHKKRGLDGVYAHDFAGFQPAFGHQLAAAPLPAPLAAPLAGPLPGPLAGPLPAPLGAAPLPAAFAGPLPEQFVRYAQQLAAPHGLIQGEPLLHHDHALPAAPLPAPHGLVQAEQFVQHAHLLPLAAHHNIPVQFRTLVKNIPVPYERHIHVDNPIYTPVEHQVPIDNPVPVVKYVTQHVPQYVEQHVQVPVLKEERIPEPYLHKVRLVIQRVFLEEAPKTYLPPPPPRQNYLPPPPAPNNNYIPPTSTPFRASPPAPAPPSTNYGVPEHQH